MRYWSMSLGVAASGALIAISRFAFGPTHANWIIFGLAIAATVLSLAATAVALLRENHAFSGLSALSALIAAWTIIATRAFTGPTALWLGFAGGLALLLLSVRALALHETTVERVVHALELDGSGEGTLAIRRAPAQPAAATTLRGTGFEISGVMRSWMRWLAYVGLALAGAFVVLATFAWQDPTQGVSVRWLAFGVGIGAAFAALSALLERGLAIRIEGPSTARVLTIAITATAAAIAIALIVLMVVLHGSDARWWAFGLGAGLAVASLVAATIHELSSERIRHELEIRRATSTPAEQATEAAH
jgi:hypothetical protein